MVGLGYCGSSRLASGLIPSLLSPSAAGEIGRFFPPSKAATWIAAVQRLRVFHICIRIRSAANRPIGRPIGVREAHWGQPLRTRRCSLGRGWLNSVLLFCFRVGGFHYSGSSISSMLNVWSLGPVCRRIAGFHGRMRTPATFMPVMLPGTRGRPGRCAAVWPD